MSNYIKKFLYFFFNLLFPIACIVCGEEGSDLCERCISDLHPPKRRTHDWVSSLGNYRDDSMKKVLWHIKKMPNHRAAQILAEIFKETIQNQPRDPTSWVLIPIPITRTRFRERGYNQAELLGEALSKTLGISYDPTILIKNRHTAKQGTTKSKEERMTNLHGSFSVNYPEKIMGKSILLLDDITTTGSTLIEARTTLLATGALKVIAITVAN